MRQLRRTTRALRAVVTGALLWCCAAQASAQEAAAPAAPPVESSGPPAEPAVAAPPAEPAVAPVEPAMSVEAAAASVEPAPVIANDEPAAPPAEPAAPSDELAPVISNLGFEGAAFLSVTFAELAVPEDGSLNPVGGGGYLALRYVPATFPFHAYFESGGSVFATGSTTSPGGTDYDNRIAAWFFTPGVGFDLCRLRVTAGLGPALVMTRHFSAAQDSSTLTLGISSHLGLAYRFFEKTPWATSVELRYQTVPGAKINALSLGLRLRFASITYR